MSSNCGLPENAGVNPCLLNTLNDLGFIMLTERGKNTFATLSAMTEIAITTAINDTDKQDRLLPIYEIENNEPTASDPSIQTFNSGRKVFVKDGVISFSFLIVGGDFKTKAAIKSFNNGKYDAYFYDRNGGLLYRRDADTTENQVKPIRIAQSSFVPKMEFSNGTDKVQGVMVTLDFDMSNRESEYEFVPSADLDYNIADICVPLITIPTPIFSNITTTTAKILVKTDRNTGVVGLTTANISALTVGGVAKTVSSLVPDVAIAGLYTLTWTTAGTSAQVGVITWTGAGYDWYNANQGTFTI